MGPRKLELPSETLPAHEEPAQSSTREFEPAGVRPPPGLPPPLGMPSHGSCLHGTGRCRPCMWFFKPSGCSHGQECLHCHLCPQSEMAARRKRRMRRTRLGADNALFAKDVDSEFALSSYADMDTSASAGSASGTESLISAGSTLAAGSFSTFRLL